MSAKAKAAVVLGCPCGSTRPYAHCCAPLHEGAAAATAEALMRSRYSAFALRRTDYLLASWHPSTRPQTLELDPQTRWLGLRVLAHHVDDARHARVEFVARYALGGGSAQKLHEHSRFVCEDGHWYYVDGEIAADAP